MAREAGADLVDVQEVRLRRMRRVGQRDCGSPTGRQGCFQSSTPAIATASLATPTWMGRQSAVGTGVGMAAGADGRIQRRGTSPSAKPTTQVAIQGMAPTEPTSASPNSAMPRAAPEPGRVASSHMIQVMNTRSGENR